jgi:hypothetical protein
MTAITQSRLKDLFDYQDGHLIRKISRGRGKNSSRWSAGTVVGHKAKNGYVLANVDYKTYKLHRLVWLWHHGHFPERLIDHIDGDPSNNRIENLREATYAENMQNQRKARSTNKLGVQGVYRVKNKFRAVITKNKVSKHIGYFDTAEEAHEAYIRQKRNMHEFSTI